MEITIEQLEKFLKLKAKERLNLSPTEAVDLFKIEYALDDVVNLLNVSSYEAMRYVGRCVCSVGHALLFTKTFGRWPNFHEEIVLKILSQFAPMFIDIREIEKFEETFNAPNFKRKMCEKMAFIHKERDVRDNLMNSMRVPRFDDNSSVLMTPVESMWFSRWVSDRNNAPAFNTIPAYERTRIVWDWLCKHRNTQKQQG